MCNVHTHHCYIDRGESGLHTRTAGVHKRMNVAPPKEKGAQFFSLRGPLYAGEALPSGGPSGRGGRVF